MAEKKVHLSTPDGHDYMIKTACGIEGYRSEILYCNQDGTGMPDLDGVTCERCIATKEFKELN